MRIRAGEKCDAPLIAEAIMQAVGDEITVGFAGSAERVGLVRQLFTELAECDDSQYSYRNTLAAETADGQAVGYIIAYDGAGLRRMRERFIEKANSILGYAMSQESMTDETVPGEIYLDTLCVFEPWRGQGISTALINAAIERHKAAGKPFGLLVDKSNERARRIYERLGFRQVGETPFAGELMDHLQKV